MSTRKTASLTGDLIARPADRSVGIHDNDNVSRSRRRSLVLTNESARHGFRATLSSRVKRGLQDIPVESLLRLTTDDARGFASVYLAATAGILAFII